MCRAHPPLQALLLHAGLALLHELRLALLHELRLALLHELAWPDSAAPTHLCKSCSLMPAWLCCTQASGGDAAGMGGHPGGPGSNGIRAASGATAGCRPGAPQLQVGAGCCASRCLQCAAWSTTATGGCYGQRMLWRMRSLGRCVFLQRRHACSSLQSAAHSSAPRARGPALCPTP